MTKHDLLTETFTFPFKLHEYQADGIEEGADLDCVLLRHPVGLGKTVISTGIALLHSIEWDVERILILAPPILLDQWAEWIVSIDGVDDALVYRGSPKERFKMDLGDYPVVIMSYNIFRGKKDFPRIERFAKNNRLAVIADELSCKSLKSKTYKLLKKVVYRKIRVKMEDEIYHRLIALNATPISDPIHVYNWLALMRPGIYYSKKQFEALHVRSYDDCGDVKEWMNEDLLRSNMRLISIDADKDLIKLPKITYDVVPYSLSDRHMNLYRKIKNAKFDELPTDKIELVINGLFHALQKLILTPHEFDLDIRPAILDYIDGYLDQLGNEQLIIFTRHVSVSRMLNEYIKDSVAVYGQIKGTKRDDNLQRFEDGDSQFLIANMDSLGVGMNLQFCQRTLFAELPFRGDKFNQLVGRTHRQGQTKPCFANIPLAKGTLQRRIYRNLLDNDDDICKIVNTREAVRKFLEG